MYEGFEKSVEIKVLDFGEKLEIVLILNEWYAV